MHLPAKQFVNWLVRLFADDVPTRHFERRQNPHQGQIGMLGKAAGIHSAPHIFDVVRVIACDITRKHILYHFGDKMGFERHAIGFTDTRHTAIGRYLDEDKIASAKMRRRIAHDKGFDIGQLHAVRNPLIDLISRKSRTPNSPYSRPLPDCLYPPNGAI